jgi:cell division protein FtsB
MAVYRFLRSLVVLGALYGVAGLVSAYFVWHGVNGQRGLKAGVEYEQRIGELRRELDALKAERGQWERKIALIGGDQIDFDILDDQVRASLGRVHRNEVVILLPQRAAPASR